MADTTARRLRRNGPKSREYVDFRAPPRVDRLRTTNKLHPVKTIMHLPRNASSSRPGRNPSTSLFCTLLGAALTAAGCAARSDTISSGAGGAGGGATASASASSGGGSGDVGGGTFGQGGPGSGGSGGGQGVSAAYAHTDKTLYEFDPSAPTLTTKKVGNFDCIGGSGQATSMTDVAVDSQGGLRGISSKSVYQLAIQGGAVHCSKTIPLVTSGKVSFYGLTFAPVGVIDPGKEVLVAGNTDGELWAIDDNGGVTQHGTLGIVPANDGQGHTYPASNQGKRWELSGDIVFLANGGKPVAFATVRDCPSPPSTSGCNTTDTLLELDAGKLAGATTQSVAKAVRGQIVERPGCSDPSGGPYGSMYGIAAWNSKVYGFSHGGAIVEIDNVTGGACLVTTTTNLWDGAGVTTVAPVIAPPPPK
jgi:hypothetical protein